MTDEQLAAFLDSLYASVQSPRDGGCRICAEGLGWDDDDMAFDMEENAWYHPECLPDDCSSLHDYDTR